MADIRGIPTTDAFSMGRMIAAASPPAGFTQGRRYWPLAVGVDCAPVPPVVYILTADDNGALKAVPSGTFTFNVDNLTP